MHICEKRPDSVISLILRSIRSLFCSEYKPKCTYWSHSPLWHSSPRPAFSEDLLLPTPNSLSCSPLAFLFVYKHTRQWLDLYLHLRFSSTRQATPWSPQIFAEASPSHQGLPCNLAAFCTSMSTAVLYLFTVSSPNTLWISLIYFVHYSGTLSPN